MTKDEQNKKVFHGLEYLYLSSNNLTKLPDSIENCPDLKRLDVDNNTELQSVSENIGNLKNLEEFNLSNTNIKTLPKELNNLRKLYNFNYNSHLLQDEVNDKLGKLMVQIKINKQIILGDTSNLSIYDEKIDSEDLKDLIENNPIFFKNLQYLNLQSETLTNLPNEINRLINLTDFDSNLPKEKTTEVNKIVEANEQKLEELKTQLQTICEANNIPESVQQGNAVKKLFEGVEKVIMKSKDAQLSKEQENTFIKSLNSIKKERD